MQIVRVGVAEMQETAEQLTAQHYKEVPYGQKNLPMELDWGLYSMLEKEGCLLVLAAVVKGEGLVGYLVIVTSPMLHHKGRYMAQTDSFYVAPAHRKNGVFEKLLQEAQRLCKEADVVSLRIAVNNNFHLPAEMLESLGYYEAERQYDMEF